MSLNRGQTSFLNLKVDTISLHSVDNSTIQYRLLPVGKNIIRARFENLADRFDENWESFKIDIGQFAHELY